MLIPKKLFMKRSGQVHQETLETYTDELKEKRAAGEKLTKRELEANNLSTCESNLSPALAPAIGLFEIDGMAI